MKILIVKNITREGPGILEELLNEHQIEYDLIDLDKGEQFPNPKNYRALVVLGGPDSANDSTEKIQTELAQIQEAIKAGIPYLGICLGLQTLVKACGGNVIPSPTREVGFRDPEGNLFNIDLTPEGKSDPLFAGLTDNFKVFHLHGETVEITPHMTLLGTGKWCKNQIVKIGQNAYGIQCHFELTPEMFNLWLNEDHDLQSIGTKELKKDFKTIQSEYTQTGRTLFTNFLRIALTTHRL